jgi:hypothetical protein
MLAVVVRGRRATRDAALGVAITVGGTPARSAVRGRGVGSLPRQLVDHAPETMAQHYVLDVLVRIIRHLSILRFPRYTRGRP